MKNKDKKPKKDLFIGAVFVSICFILISYVIFIIVTN